MAAKLKREQQNEEPFYDVAGDETDDEQTDDNQATDDDRYAECNAGS